MHRLPFSIIDGQSLFKDFDNVQDPETITFSMKLHRIVTIENDQWKLSKCIYVQVYEDRIDLHRAIIIGASGTPYKDVSGYLSSI